MFTVVKSITTLYNCKIKGAKMTKKEYLSITEVAKLLNLSRTTIHNKIKSGEIKALKIGKTFAVPTEEIKKIVGDIIGHPLSDEEKRKINEVIERTVEEYGKVLKMLGKE